MITPPDKAAAEQAAQDNFMTLPEAMKRIGELEFELQRAKAELEELTREIYNWSQRLVL